MNMGIRSYLVVPFKSFPNPSAADLIFVCNKGSIGCNMYLLYFFAHRVCHLCGDIDFEFPEVVGFVSWATWECSFREINLLQHWF
jgi:hypothetical protein